MHVTEPEEGPPRRPRRGSAGPRMPGRVLGGERGRARRALLVGALAVAVLGCTSAGPVDDGPAALRVASGPELESQLLTSAIVLLLEDAGIAAERVVLADGRSARQAVDLGDAEITVAYSGEEWLTRLGRADPPADPAVAFEALERSDRSRGLTWIVPAGGSGIEEPPANATFAFFVAGPPAVDADLRTLSDLSLRLSERPELSLCVDTEFGRRPDGLSALLSAYSVRRDRPFLAASQTEAVARVRDGDCVAGLSAATDGRAWRSGLRPLVDDLRFFPALVPAPVVRTAVLEATPGLEAALRPLTDRLSTGMLGRANGAVVGGQDLTAAAADLVARLRETPR